MLRYRIIPTLLLHNKGLFKTVKFSLKKGKYIGDPINAIKIFNDKGVDELIFLDIDASKEDRGPDFEIIKNIASECFMPVAYGGGIVNIDQIKEIFRIGIEKVVLNTILLNDMSLLKEASKIFGSQSIVASIDINRTFYGKYKLYDSSQNKNLQKDIKTYIKHLQLNGAGEIYISAVHRDGTFSGYDIDMLNNFISDIQVPVIVNGGARDVCDFAKVIKQVNISALSAGSLFVFQGPHKAVLITYPNYDELKSQLGEY
jgi:cyclase